MGAHLRVEAMLRIVRLDEIVGELVSEDDPPPDGGVGAPLGVAVRIAGVGGGGSEVLSVQLEEEAEVAEEAAGAVEGDGAARLVVEDVQCGGGQGVDVGELAEQGRERVEQAMVVRQEAADVDSIGPRDEHAHAKDVGGELADDRVGGAAAAYDEAL